jgi:hypothetical protein
VPLGASDALRPVQSQLVSKAREIGGLYQRLAGVLTAHDRNIVQREITSIDRQIDDLTCELFDLTGEEVSIVWRTPQTSPGGA